MFEKCLLVLCCTVVFSTCNSELPKRMNIVGLFDKDDPSREVFERYALRVNEIMYEKNSTQTFYFNPSTREITNDLYELSQTGCSVIENWVVTIFGPAEKYAAEYIRNMCDQFDLPNIVWREDLDPVRVRSINIYPHFEELSKLFVNLVETLKWKGYTILYDKTENLRLLNGLLKRYNASGPTVTVRHLGDGPNYREPMIDIRKTTETNIIIACSYKILEEVLKQSLQSGILSAKHQVIVTNLDFQAIDLEPYKYSGVKLIGVRFVDVDNPIAQDIFNNNLRDLGEVKDLSKLRVGQALTYDAIQLLADALNVTLNETEVNVSRLSCSRKDGLEFGLYLNNVLRSTEINGLTGLVKTHIDGFRSDFEIDVVYLNHKGLKSAGIYNTTMAKFTNNFQIEESQHDTLKNLSFKILIAMNKPHIMLTNSSIKQSGNDRYEGFAIDLIKLLAERLEFNYTFIVHNGGYGSRGKNGKWSGMLGDIMDGKADLAITDLTITAERQSVVDFTTPFMNLGINILYKKPTGAAPSLFSFLAPFSKEVYYYLAAAYLFVSLCLFALGRMCPAEWNCPYPCIEEPEVLENQFTLKNALWFTLGSIMQQGSEIAPIGLSTRLLASAWWFFCLIMVASYTANIAALLVVETVVIPFRNAEELANMKGKIKYGAKRDGATLNFFNVSDKPIHKTMFEYMMDNEKEVLTDSNEEGRDKVLAENGGYAFFMESKTIEYVAQRYCLLSKVNEHDLDSKGYGIAMKKGFKHRRKFNNVILQLKEDATLRNLEDKWWKELYNEAKCDKATVETTSSKMTLEHVGGVFLVLGIGVALAVLFTIWEFVWDICWNTHTERLSFKEKFVKEMRFVLRCKGHVKPVRGRRSSSDGLRGISRDQSTPPYGSVPTVMTTSLEN